MEKKTFTLSQLAHLTGSRPFGEGPYEVSNVADLDSATPQDVSFLSNPRYEQAMERSRAGIVFIAPGVTPCNGRNFLIAENPSLAFQKVVDLFYDPLATHSGFHGIHPSAVIHESVRLGKNVTIAPCAVIDRDVTIGDDTIIGAGCSIGPQTQIGNCCLLHPRVVIRELCLIGNRVIIQPGAVIGSCGFGYVTDKQGRHIKLNQAGNVVIQDDVEIGACTTIDRARFKSTIIKRGTKIDNLVQIAHGVVVGEDNMIISQSGIAGSTETGRHVILAGQTAIAGHIKLADGVIVSARSGVSKSLTKAGKYGGAPAYDMEEHNRNTVYLRNIEKYVNRIKELEKRLAALEERIQ